MTPSGRRFGTRHVQLLDHHDLEPQTPALGQKRDATWLVFLIENGATNSTRRIASRIV
jgi:hypothetical protein